MNVIDEKNDIGKNQIILGTIRKKINVLQKLSNHKIYIIIDRVTWKLLYEKLKKKLRKGNWQN